MSNQELKIKLLELEIEALRSVLSEFQGTEKTDEILNCHTQWHKAQAIAELRNHIV